MFGETPEVAHKLPVLAQLPPQGARLGPPIGPVAAWQASPEAWHALRMRAVALCGARCEEKTYKANDGTRDLGGGMGSHDMRELTPRFFRRHSSHAIGADGRRRFPAGTCVWTGS